MPGGRDTPEARQARIEAVDEEEPVVASGQLLVARTWRPERADVVYRESATNPRFRRGIGNGRTALVASAAHVPLNDRRAVESVRRRHQAWQTEAWDYFDEVGEIGYTTSYIANLCSKLRLYPAIEGLKGEPVPLSLLSEDPPDDPDADPNRDARKELGDAGITPAIADYAEATLRRLRSMQGGQSALLRELSLNLEVAGECYLHGHATPRDVPEPGNTIDYGGPTGGPLVNTQPGDDVYEMGTDPSMVEDWNIRSVDELIITGDRFELRLGPGTKVSDPVPDTDLIIRIWERHPRFSELATCAMRRVLAEAEALLLLSREIRATSKSRLSNGILLIPSELSFGPIDPTRDSGDGEETDDPFDAELQEAMITPIQEEGSASAVVPLVLRGPAELLQHVNHLALDKTLDPVLDTRIEQRILRIARGLNMPAEVTTGLMSTTFANAVQVKRSEFEDHIEPRAILICDAITSGYFQWALEVGDGETEGLDPEVARQIFVWFDASQLIRVEDQSEMAVEAQRDGVISAEARRRYCGFTEADAPDMDELALLGLIRASRMEPTLQDFLWRKVLDDPTIPITAPPSGVLGIGQSVSSMPAPGAPPQGNITVGGEKVQLPPPPPPPPPVTVIHQTPAGEPTDENGNPTAAKPAPGQPSAPEDEPAKKTPTGPSAKPVAASASPEVAWRRLGSVLAGIDRDVRTRIIARLDSAMRLALDRAGNRIKAKVQRDKGGTQSALRKAVESVPSSHVAAQLGATVVESIGMSSADLIAGSFDPALAQIVGLLDAAYEHALAAIEKLIVISEPRRLAMDAAHGESVKLAVDYLKANLHALAADRLYSPEPGAPLAGEHDDTVLIPANMVRAAVAIAGGAAVQGANSSAGFGASSAWVKLGGSGPVTDASGQPLGGIGTGPNLSAALDDAGASTDGWQWDYGTAVRAPFEPHVDLDGVIVASTDDDALANGGGFPEGDFYFPGDHDGCLCDIVPVMIPPPVVPAAQQAQTAQTETETPEVASRQEVTDWQTNGGLLGWKDVQDGATAVLLAQFVELYPGSTSAAQVALSELAADWQGAPGTANDVITRMLDEWSMSSNSSPMSLALQDAAVTVFGLDSAANWVTGDQSILDQKDSLLRDHSDVIETFLQAQYNLTQAQLDDNELAAINMYNSQQYDSIAEMPEWAQEILLAEGDITLTNPRTRPLTSMTYDPGVTPTPTKPVQVRLSATVPAKKILSLAKTGMGSLQKREAVVLGNLDEMTAHATSGESADADDA